MLWFFLRSFVTCYMGRALLLLLILAPPPLRGSGQQEGLPPTPGRQQQTEDDDVAAPRYHSVASPALQQFFRARYPAPKLTASDGRLLLAQPVVAGEELFAVPRARILTASTVRELSDFLDAGVDVVSPPPPPRSLWLPLWLSYERHRPDSPHAAYLAALPTAFHLPFLWSPAERAGLRSSWLGAAVEEDVLELFGGVHFALQCLHARPRVCGGEGQHGAAAAVGSGAAPHCERLPAGHARCAAAAPHQAEPLLHWCCRGTASGVASTALAAVTTAGVVVTSRRMAASTERAWPISSLGSSRERACTHASVAALSAAIRRRRGRRRGLHRHAPR